MNDVKNLVGEKKQYTIKGVDFWLEPIDLFNDDNGFDLLLQASDESSKIKFEAIKKIFELTLIKSGITADMSFGTKLLQNVLDVNGLGPEEGKNVVSTSSKNSSKKED